VGPDGLEPPTCTVFVLFEICESVVHARGTLLLRKRDQVGARGVAHRDPGQLPCGVGDTCCDHVSPESNPVTSFLICTSATPVDSSFALASSPVAYSIALATAPIGPAFTHAADSIAAPTLTHAADSVAAPAFTHAPDSVAAPAFTHAPDSVAAPAFTHAPDSVAAPTLTHVAAPLAPAVILTSAAAIAYLVGASDRTIANQFSNCRVRAPGRVANRSGTAVSGQ
jgi:hypothetical protein